MFACHVFGQTTYVNGQRQGLILEKPFCLGDTITKGIGSSYFSAHQNTVLDIEAEIKLAFYSRRHSSASASVTQEIKELGVISKMFMWKFYFSIILTVHTWMTENEDYLLHDHRIWHFHKEGIVLLSLSCRKYFHNHLRRQFNSKVKLRICISTVTKPRWIY